MKNTTLKTTADQAEAADSPHEDIGAGSTPLDDLTKPSRSELLWLKSAGPTIGASPEDGAGGSGTSSTQA